MKGFQREIFHYFNKSALLKSVIIPLMLLFCLSDLYAQNDSNVKLKIEAGFLWDWVDGRVYLSGPFLNVEPKLKTSINTTIGLRFGAAQSTQRILTSNPNLFHIDNIFDNGNSNGIFSFVPTFDYNFNNRKVRPYLGLGVGYYFLTTSKDVFESKNYSKTIDVSVQNKVGFLLRGGVNLYKVLVRRLDLSNLTIGLEFNFIPKADVIRPNEQIIGTVNNSNIALSIGYRILD